MDPNVSMLGFSFCLLSYASGNRLGQRGSKAIQNKHLVVRVPVAVMKTSEPPG